MHNKDLLGRGRDLASDVVCGSTLLVLSFIYYDKIEVTGCVGLVSESKAGVSIQD